MSKICSFLAKEEYLMRIHMDILVIPHLFVIVSLAGCFSLVNHKMEWLSI